MGATDSRTLDVPSYAELWSLLQEGSDSSDEFVAVAGVLHDSNRFQWDREMAIRDTRLQAAGVARVKREIDSSNRRRVRLVERLDAICARRIGLTRDATPRGYVNSETIGQLVDRLSILSLKLAFVRARAATCRADEQAETLARELELQRDYLAACYDRFLEHLRAGTGSMPVSRQLKFYGEEDL